MAATVSEQETLSVNVQEGGSGESGVLIFGWNTQETTVINGSTGKTTDVNGDVTDTDIEQASHSVTGFVTTTTNRKPIRVRAVKYGLNFFETDLELTEPFGLVVFATTNTSITQTTQATVDAYTGFTLSTGTDTVTLDGTGGTPIDTVDELYDRLQSEGSKATNLQFDILDFFSTTDKQNYVSAYDIQIDDFSFSGQSRSIVFATGKQLEILGGTSADVGNLTVDDADIAEAVDGQTFTAFNVTDVLNFSGTSANVEYTLDACTIEEVTRTTTGTVTLNLINGASITQTPPAGFIINNAVTVATSNVTEGTSVKVIADETVGTITDGDVLDESFADSNGEASFTINYEAAFNPSGLDVIVRARNQGIAVAALADDGGSFTDETTNANSTTTNDMTLLPAAPAVNDAYYFGAAETFGKLKLVVTTVFTASVKTFAWEYWNSSAWTSVSNPLITKSNKTTTGINDSFVDSGASIYSWTIPGDWAKNSVNSIGPLYYFRIRLVTVSGVTSAPKGRKVQLDTTRYLPFVQNNVITSSGLSVVATWLEDTISKPFG